jgi:hypothetical protein
LYQCDFADTKFYQLEALVFSEGKQHKKALWLELERFRAGEVGLLPEQSLALWMHIERFKSGELRLVPEQCLDYL